MKKLLILSVFLGLFSSCEDDCDSQETLASNTILLLKVDLMTYTFEGAKELELSSEISDSETIPLYVDYAPPGDFGNIALYYEGEELIFDGSIIWMGLGEISYPESFDPPSSFSELNSTIPLPDTTRFQLIFNDFNYPSIDYSLIWNAINKLEIVNDYHESYKNIGLFLYTPSVGIGDPNDWDWFVIMNK